MTLQRLQRHKARHRTRGQSLVEFALVLPVLLLFLLIVVDFGRLFFSYIEVKNAAREGANTAASTAAAYRNLTLTSGQYYTGVANAALGETNSQAQRGASPIVVSSPACFEPGPPPISIDCSLAPQVSQSASGIGNQVTVAVTQPFTFFTPLINGFFGGSLTLSASATAVVLDPSVASVSTLSTSSTTSTSSTSTSSVSTTTTTTTTTTTCSVAVASFSYTQTSNKHFTFTDMSSAPSGCPITKWAWGFADGSPTVTPSDVTSSGPFAVVYGAANSHTVTIIVTNAGGQSVLYSHDQ